MNQIERRLCELESRHGAKHAALPPVVRIIHPGDAEPYAVPEAGRRVVKVRFVPPGDGDITRNPLQEGKA